ncbi:GAF domain-containing protein [Pleurocapsales cyanobacterium LEGE 06147]|nr:GAF domain-containing protein [Pleurocapsales cyanobacterium LEGE 06147]
MLQSPYEKLNILPWDRVGQTIVDTVGQVLKVDIAILLFYDRRRKKEHYFVYHNLRTDGDTNSQVDREILKRTVRLTKDVAIVNDFTIDEEGKQNAQLYWAYQQANIRSTLSVPLSSQQDLIAALTLHHCEKIHLWQQEEVKLAIMMATQASLAISQVQAYEQVRALAQREAMLNRITTAIRSSLEPQIIFAAITTELGEALRVNACTLSLWTKDDKFVQCVGFYNPCETVNRQQQVKPITSAVPIAENPILQKLLVTKKTVFLSDLEQHPKMARYDLPWHSFAKALLIVPLIVDEEIIGSITLRQSNHPRRWCQLEIDLAEAVAAQAAIAVQQARLYEKTRQQAEQLREREQKVQQLNTYLTESVLKRFLPEAIVNKAAAGELMLDLSPEPHRITILFCDLVGFTSLSSYLEVRPLAELLNEYLEAMTKAVFEQGGTVDKFIGDAIMALFGAPKYLSLREQAQRAIATARAMHRYLEALNQSWQNKGILINGQFPSLQLRCGIHQGKAVVGMFGGGQRKDYTAIGTAVNIASRLQEVAMPGSILVSATVAACLQDGEQIKSIEPLKLQGIEQDIIAFSVDI